ncbi:hypothetical protein SDRG_15856 [Saprolegnia diclina VS20]|uniref:Ion transport domain-containing protein n=1 Tax=Saprolegnia diclina (strain VS20) TaxID=1156394 RepID=T0PLK3_SAPDV|nr:hypothetical protein SDRG_15856 [Saprolegnia diclina VS20]EQC26269.1 hypothetical protein SDRG_15856 [Saprolegnia diclina VS20]|eukprot:XP_008620264.1 hypothetical protein SDRG_15856 [Saprolegnia diclina VS20]
MLPTSCVTEASDVTELYRDLERNEAMDDEAEVVDATSDEDDLGAWTMYNLLWRGHVNVVKTRLESGTFTEVDFLTAEECYFAMPTLGNNEPFTFLDTAAFMGHDDIVGLALAHTDFRRLNKYASKPLLLGVVEKHKRVVQILLSSIADEVDLGALRDARGSPIVHYVAEHEANEILAMLLAHGAPVDATTEGDDGETALHIAARQGNARGVELLLQAGANADARSKSGKTPLDLAVEASNDKDTAKQVLELLFLAGTEVNVPDEAMTPRDGVRGMLAVESAFRTSFPLHCIARNGDDTEFASWVRDQYAASLPSPQQWQGEFRNDADDEGEQPFQWNVQLVPVPHEACYRFVGNGVDADGRPFVLGGHWSDEGFSAEKRYECRPPAYFHGHMDASTGVVCGSWTCLLSWVGLMKGRYTFKLDVPWQLCPACNSAMMPQATTSCVGCLPEGYNSDVSEATAEDELTGLEEIQESIASEMTRPDEYGRTALMYAAREGHASILRALLFYCDEDACSLTDKDGKTALDYALRRRLVCASNVECKSNHGTLACIALLERADTADMEPSRIPGTLVHTRRGGQCNGDCVESLDEINLSVLAGRNEWGRISELLATPLSFETLHKPNDRGVSLWYHALANGKSDLVALLVKQPHIDVHEPFPNGQYPLCLAADWCRIECVRVLLDAGAHPLRLISPKHADYAEFRKTPLAIIRDSDAFHLIHAKTDLLEQYPLYYLARVQNCAQAAAYVQAQQSPMHVAISTQLPISVLSEIIDESPHDVNAQDKNQETPLMVASKMGLVDHVDVLVNNEAGVDLTNNHGQSALMMAAMGGHVAIVDHLLENMADIGLRDADNKSVFDMLQSHITTYLAGRSSHERVKSPYVQIQEAIEKEVRDSKTSMQYRAKLAASLADLTAKTAFDRNGFAKAINCAPELGVTFLNDCVTMDRHDVHFTKLDLVYGKHVTGSALHALLNMETDDPDLIFEAKSKCFEHVTIRRILEIKWELFGQRKFLEMLFMYLVLLVSMTVSAVLFHEDDTRLHATSVEVLLGALVVSLAVVGCVAVQALRPQTLWRLSRYHYDGSLEFDPELDIPDLGRHKAAAKRWLKLGVLIGTLLLTGLLVGLMVVTSSISFFPVVNNVVLAVAAIYFVLNEYHEAHGDLHTYLASTINVIQVSMYMLILVVFLPMQLNWFDTPDQIEIAVGSGITLTLWILSLQFLEVEASASYLLPMLSGLLKDLWNFFLFFGVFQIGITVTFFQLYKATDSDDFNSLSGSFLTSYFVAFGQVPTGAMGAFTNDDTKSIDGYDWILYVFAVVMIMAHSAVVVLFLLNLLVANMNKTVDGGLEKAKTEALAAYAQCILRLEEAMNSSPQETQDLIYFIPPTPTCDGKLNPIFTASMPKSYYSITPEVEAAIATHEAQQTSWMVVTKTIQGQVTSALTAFEDGLRDVAHFTDVDISVVFAKELAAIEATRSSLDTVFVSMHKSRGQQDQRKLLGRFQKTVVRELTVLKRQLDQVGAVATVDTVANDEHARCVILYKLTRRSSIASDFEVLQAHTSAVFDDAVANVAAVDADADGKDSSSALLTEMQELMEAQTASAKAAMAAMEAKNAKTIQDLNAEHAKIKDEHAALIDAMKLENAEAIAVMQSQLQTLLSAVQTLVPAASDT